MSTSGSGPVPGWYDDPADPTMARYWDGEQWTSRVRPKDSSEAPAPSYGAEASFTTATVGQRPSNYLVPAILTTIFCCLPLGIAAIVKAAQVNGLWAQGDAEGAYKASADAKKFAWISFGIGLVVLVIVIATGNFEASFNTDNTNNF